MRPDLTRLLHVCALAGGSALYLVPGEVPAIRVGGAVHQLLHEQRLAAGDIDAALIEFIPPDALGGEESAYTCELLAVGPVTCRPVRDHRGLGLVFSMLPAAEQLAARSTLDRLRRGELAFEPRRERAHVELEDVLFAERVG